MPDVAALGVVVVAAAYGVGLRRLWSRAGSGRVVHRHQALLFAAGSTVVSIALSPPVDGAAATSLAAHMAQHVLLLAVAAPLLALGAPLPTLLWVTPARVRDRLTDGWHAVLRAQRSAGWVGWAAGALLLQASVMWAWHAPVLYEAALRHDALHAVEHLTLLATSVLFWWSVAGGRQSRHGFGVLAVFVAALPGTALGAALLLAPRPWYPAYVTGTTAAALRDQQLAGVVMWSFAGIAYVIAAAILFASWVAGSDRRLAWPG